MSKVGHHRVSLESTKLVLGKSAHKYADYFETCRRKRNTIDYPFSNVATETEAKETIVQATEFTTRSKTGLQGPIPLSRSEIHNKRTRAAPSLLEFRGLRKMKPAFQEN
jgi:hypothetical protein